jgi:3-oxoadipate enol-lactonase
MTLPTYHSRTQRSMGTPWLTFVPGIGNDMTFWEDQARRLSDRFNILTFDPWGHGDSPAPPKPCRFGDIVEGLARLWDELGIAHSAVVGLGFGGSVALAAAIASPARVDKIVACCCRPRQPDDRRDFWRERRAKAGEIGIDRLADITVDRWLSPAFRASRPDADRQLRSMFKRTSLAGYQAYVDAFIEMDFTDRLPEITQPLLLVAAEHDHGGGPVAAMREMADAIASAHLEVIPDTGHIVNFEAPDALARLLHEFLGGTDDAPMGGLP